jgi:hypothetical protein
MARYSFPTTVAATALALSLTGCESAPIEPTTVTVDSRIELIGVVQYLADYMLTTSYDFDYKTDVEEHFGEFREHEAVVMFKTMASQGFSFDVVPKAMLSLTDPPGLSTRYDFPGDVLARAGGQQALDAFVETLRDFAAQTDFEMFFKNHESLFDSLTSSATPTMTATVGALEEYLGENLSGAHVILGVLLHHGGFSALFETRGAREAYALIGPAGGNGTYPGFGAARRLGSIAWHEFSHTVINDLTATHSDWIDSHSQLFEGMADDMARSGYGTWETTVNEHIIRAINVRMLLLNIGQPVGQSALDSDVARGFVYLTPLVNALQRYESDRDTYPTIEDFFPQLLDAFLEEVETPESD